MIQDLHDSISAGTAARSSNDRGRQDGHTHINAVFCLWYAGTAFLLFDYKSPLLFLGPPFYVVVFLLLTLITPGLLSNREIISLCLLLLFLSKFIP